MSLKTWWAERPARVSARREKIHVEVDDGFWSALGLLIVMGVKAMSSPGTNPGEPRLSPDEKKDLRDQCQVVLGFLSVDIDT